jgi:hypothetical protein
MPHDQIRWILDKIRSFQSARPSDPFGAHEVIWTKDGKLYVI